MRALLRRDGESGGSAAVGGLEDGELVHLRALGQGHDTGTRRAEALRRIQRVAPVAANDDELRSGGRERGVDNIAVD